MDTCSQTDRWIYYIAITLGFIAVVSILGISILFLMRHETSEILVATGFISTAGLAKLAISPISHEAVE